MGKRCVSLKIHMHRWKQNRGPVEHVFGLGELPLEQRRVTFSLGACRCIWLHIKEIETGQFWVWDSDFPGSVQESLQIFYHIEPLLWMHRQHRWCQQALLEEFSLLFRETIFRSLFLSRWPSALSSPARKLCEDGWIVFIWVRSSLGARTSNYRWNACWKCCGWVSSML